MHTEEFIYPHDNTNCHGFLAYDHDPKEKRPVVLIAHAWGGREEFVCEKAQALAELGYVGFALDIYGEGKIGGSKEQNMELIMPFMEDRTLLRHRLLAGFNAVKKLSMADAKRIGAIGFCFGGLCALDLARSGADVKGVVSFHGLLIPPENVVEKKITAKVLALHGHDDPMVPPEQVLAFQQEMTKAKVDWQMHIYGNTMHAFTNPEANDKDFGTVYNANANRRSWQAMQDFFAEVL